MCKIFVFIGSSGSGKTEIRKRVSHVENRIVTTTTRHPRQNEVDRVDYNFVTKSKFDQAALIEKDEKYGNCYGLEKKEVESKFTNGNCFAILTHSGYIELKKVYGEDVIGIFIDTPMEDLKKMLGGRGEEDVLKRLSTYKSDRDNIDDYEYVVENKYSKLQEAIDKVESIITGESKYSRL